MSTNVKLVFIIIILCIVVGVIDNAVMEMKSEIMRIVKPYCYKKGNEVVKQSNDYFFDIDECIDVQFQCYGKLRQYTDNVNKEIFLFLKENKLETFDGNYCQLYTYLRVNK